MELTVTREPWTVAALCAQIGGDEWFPDYGDPYRDALRVCRRCPVTAQCLTYALEHDEQEGIWGGRTPGQRRRIANGLPPTRRREPKPCGTVPAYHRHLYNREPTCQPCRNAMPQAINARRTRNQVTP